MNNSTLRFILTIMFFSLFAGNLLVFPAMGDNGNSTGGSNNGIIASANNTTTAPSNNTAPANNTTTAPSNNTAPANNTPTNTINNTPTNTINNTPTNSLHSTNVSVTSNPNFSTGNKVIITTTITDTSSSPTPATGSISWSDSAGGSFSSVSCTLLSGSCFTVYTPSTNSPSVVTITASYEGDSTHSTSTGQYTLTISIPHSTITTITPNSVTANPGSQVTFTANLSDTTSFLSNSTGTILWSDGNIGGTFNPTSCTLSSESCSVSYTVPASVGGNATIIANYVGDSSHSASSGASHVSIIIPPPSLLLSTDQLYYAYGDVVTLSVNIPGQTLQNIAVSISDPNNEDIISRTVTTDENGKGTLQFKIPSTYQTGVYKDVATSSVYGKSYVNSTQFNVIKSHGLSIDSIQITNQQGDPISMLKKGQNGFIKVSISSGETMPALLTFNLFDANQSSLGTASVKSIINSGDSQTTLSFFIPSSSQAGLANVFIDAYSDWPTNGGTPLTTESCLSADLQDPSTLPISYVPISPQTCSAHNVISSGDKTFSTMTNDKALVTLGVAIQNDSMTFMSPTEAHLLALAFNNGTAHSGSNSVGLVTLDMNNLNSTNSAAQTSGNVTKIGPTEFTTIAGPDLQNNPMALKILQEIQTSKRQVANILGNETAAKLDQQLIEQQRQAAAAQLKQDLSKLELLYSNNTSNTAYANFLSTVSDNRTQSVFQDEFNFMKQRVSAANAAMQTVLDNNGSWEQAVLVFNKYATINHVQMVELNKNLNVKYGLADGRIQSCFDSNGQLAVVNGINPCIANIENNSTLPNGVSILSVQPTDQNGNPVSLFEVGHSGFVKVIVQSNTNNPSLITVNLFDSNMSSLGTASVKYTLNPGKSEVVLPYYVPTQSGTGLASLYANVFTDWPNKGGLSQSNEFSYVVGLWKT